MLPLILGFVFSLSIAAPLSLQEALKASPRSDEKQLLQLQKESIIADVDLLIASTLPTVDFTTGISENWQSSSALLSSPSLTALKDNATGISFPTYLQSTNYHWKLSASQPLNLARLGTVKEMAEEQIAVLKLQTKNQENQVSLQIAQAFLQVYTLQKDLQTKKKVLETQKYLETSSTLNLKHQLLSEHMWQQIQVQTELKQNQVKQSELSLHSAKLQLANLLNIPSIDSLHIQQNFIEVLLQTYSGENLEQQWARKQVILQKKNINFENSYFYPDLMLVGDISNNNSYSHEDGLNDFNVDQDAYYQPKFFNYSIGLQLNWNIFRGGSTKAKVHKAKVEARRSQIQENQINEKINKAKTEFQQQIPLLASFLQASEKQENLLWKQYQIDQNDFQKGRLRLAELLTSEQNYLQASYQSSQNKTQYLLSLLQLRILEGQDLGAL